MLNIPQDVPSSSTELESFKLQQSTLSVLNLIALATLLLIHIFFANYYGMPTATLIVILGAAFGLRAFELIWVQSRMTPPSRRELRLLTWASVVLNLALAFVAAMLTNRPDAQYFVLLAMPVIEAAFRFDLFTTSVVIIAAGALNYLWIIDYTVHQRGPVQPSEYFEAGTISLIYAFVGVLVWMLVNDLRRNQAALRKNFSELEETRERLVMEEKLAAVGRLSSAIAHEIRNPVAMISSSLLTAARENLDQEQRDLMHGIATKEAARLERLTSDFLAYARPRPPVTSLSNLSELVMYVADLSRANAESKRVNLAVNTPDKLLCEFDPASMQQVLLNLIMNAIDASPRDGTVTVRETEVGNFALVEVENPGPGIPADLAGRIFEPFFTTKPQGTGLGLAIARNIARSQGGDVSLTVNGPEHVTFCVAVPVAQAVAAGAGRE